PQSDHAEKGCAERQQAGEADEEVAHLDDRQAQADVAEVRPEQQRREALEEEEQPARRQQLVDRRRSQDGRDDELVDQHAQDGDEDDGDDGRDRQRHAMDGIEPVDGVHAAHHQLGVGYPHDVDDAEDEVEAQRQQRQDAAQQDAV
ncbi:Uncharacterized protein APZ42_003283, partial [Daphnia magna]